jgi:hypothetical protein
VSIPAPETARAADPLIWWLTGALAVWYATFGLVVGPLFSSDSEWYKHAGDLLIAHWPDLPGYLRATNYHGNIPIFYLGFTALVGAARALFGAYALHALVIVNALALAATAHLVLRTVDRLAGSRISVLVVATLFALCYEQLEWVAYVLSDCTFALLATLVLCLVVAPVRDGDSPTRRLGPAWLIALLAPLYRPTGVWLAGWLLLGSTLRPIWREPSARRRAVRLRWVLLGGAVAGALMASLLGWLIMGPRFGGSPVLVTIGNFIRPGFATGAVVEARPDTYTPPPVTWLDVTSLIGKRVVYFFVFSADGLSRAHVMANAAIYVPTYLLALVAIGAALSQRRPVSLAEQRAVGLTVLAIAGFAVMHAVTIVDFDWRYRVPVYPALFLLAGLGAGHVASLAQRLRRRAA